MDAVVESRMCQAGGDGLGNKLGVGIKSHLLVCLHPPFPSLKTHQLLSETHRDTENPK